MKRFKMIVAYDGTNYHGFAKQNEAITVQGTLEKAIQKITQEEVVSLGAGRTDAGVHAKGQCVTFDSLLKYQQKDYSKPSIVSCLQTLWFSQLKR